MDHLIMPIGFVKCDRPLFSVWTLYCGSVEQEWSYLVEMLYDSGRVELVCVCDQQNGVCHFEEGLFDYLLSGKCEGGDVRKSNLLLSLVCVCGNFVVAALTVSVFFVWCLCWIVSFLEKLISSY